jgi:tetratricopeptide (TPR) repeat protein
VLQHQRVSRLGVCLAIAAVAMFASACRKPDVKKKEYYDRGVELAAQKNYSEAILQFKNALKVDARYGEARLALADALNHTGDERQSAREYLRAAELLPNDADAQTKAAFILVRTGEFERARQRAAAAIKINPKNVDAQLLLANALAGLKEPDAAMRELEQAIQLSPDDSRSFASLGTLQAMRGNNDEAESAFKRAVAISPTSVAAKLALAYFYWNTKRPDEAEKTLVAASAADPKDPLANRMLAMFYLTHQRAPEAEAPLRRLVDRKDANAALTLGDLYVAMRQPDKARPLYESIKERKDMRTTAIARLASLAYSERKTADAHAVLDAALKDLPNDVQLLTLKARWYVNERKLDDALTYAKKAVAADEKAIGAHYALGLAYAARGETEPAIKELNETLRLNPKAAAAELHLSRLLLSKGDSSGALAHAEAAQNRAPNSPDTRLNLVRALLATRDLTRASAELEPLRKQYDNSAEVHALSASLLLARSDAAGAVRELDRALQLDPTNSLALTTRLTLDLRSKKPDDGRARLATALAKKPDDAGLLLLAGRFEMTAGNAAQSEQYLRKSLERNPGNVDAYTTLGRLYVSQHKLDEAKTEFEHLAARRPDAVVARTMVAMILQLQKKEEESIKVYEEVVSASAAAGVASNNLAYVYATRGEKLDRALELAQRAKQLMPDRADVNDTLGYVYYRKELATLAIPPLESSVKKEPANPLYQFHLGLAYAKAGRAVDARRALQEALKLSPDFPGAAEAKTTLAGLKG